MGRLTLYPPYIVKVPQIVKCVSAGSVENLSYLATFLELAAATFTCSYNLHKGFAFRYILLKSFHCFKFDDFVSSVPGVNLYL